MKNRKPQIVLALLSAGALALSCTNEQNAAVNHPEPATSPSGAAPEPDRTSANPKNDVDNNADNNAAHMAPTPPGTPPEDQRIPEEVAPSK